MLVRSAQPAIDVLLLDAQCRQTVACMWAYADRGLKVAAAASNPGVPALRSSRLSETIITADERDEAAYARSVLEVIEAHAFRMVLPAHDGSISALRPHRTEIDVRSRLAIASDSALDVAISKPRTLELAEELGIRIPRSLRARDQAELRVAWREMGGPLVLKPVESWVSGPGGGVRVQPSVAETEGQAAWLAERVFSVGGELLVQEWLPGLREAVTFFRARGRTWTRFAQKSYREWPALGGASVLSESIPLLPEIVEPAERLVSAIGLDGTSMVEFRRDRENRPVLMEINPRMGGSAMLPILCGIDLPWLTYGWATDRCLKETSRYRVGKRTRWLAGDIRNLRQTFKERGQIETRSPLRSVGTFVSDFVRRPAALDPFTPGDRRPGLIEMDQIVVAPARRKLGALFGI